MSPRRLLRLVGLITGIALIWVAAPLPLATAAYVHEWEGNFPLVAPKETFTLPLGASIDNSGGGSDGDLYVGSTQVFGAEQHSSVAKYDPDGNFLFEFDGTETPAGSFGFLSEELIDTSFSVDSSSGPNAGDVWVGDAEHGLINRFDEAGKYVCQITGAATPSASECNGAAGSEVPSGPFAPGGVAVDPTDGDVYVVDQTHKTILRFAADGSYAGQISNPHLTAPNAIAVDSTGALYVANNGPLFQEEAANVVKLSPAGEFLFEMANHAIRVAVDLSTDRVYVVEGLEESKLVEFTSGGNSVSEFGQAQELLAPSIAVNATSGRLYATNFRFEGSVVEMYGRGAIVPDVVTGEATDAGETSVTLHGTVDPAEGGDVTVCEFEYVDQAHYDPKAANPYAEGPPPLPCEEGMPLSKPSAVSAVASGLTPSTTYHVRLVAGNANGNNRAEDTIFATKGAPTIEAEGVTGIERTGATLTALINPRGYPSEFAFEFVDDQHFDAEGGFASAATKTTVFSEIGEGLKPLAVAQGISGLQVGTTYHFRAVALNERGTVWGEEKTFTTLPVAALGRQWAYAHFSTATLEASIGPLGLETTCWAEYVSDDQFEESGYAEAKSAPCVEHLSGSQMRTGRAELTGLEKATTYHFRFVVENSSGVLTAVDETFTTFGIEEFSVHVIDSEGNPYTQAGGYPFASVTHITYTHTMVASGNEGTEGAVNAFIKDVFTDMPVGRTGSAVATPRCPGYLVEEEQCSGDAQVGTITTEYFDGGERSTRTRALYNVYTPEGKASRFSSIDPYVNTDAQIRTGDDYGTTIATNEITEEARIVGVTATIWGVPADPRHDPQRRCPGIGTGCSSNAPPAPLLRNPTKCGEPLFSRALVDTWQSPGDYDAASFEMPAMTGCDQLRFEPTVEAQPTVSSADSPTGMRVRIHLPQDQDPETTATADLRDAVVRLPEGVTINPAVASGLQACSEAQIDLSGAGPAQCPEAAKVGSAQITTPLLDHPLPGAVYVATPHANPFDSLLALYVAIHDPETGVVLKLAGEVEADSATGQLTARFSDNPQLPFEDLDLNLFGGSRAMLRTPALCRTYEAESTLSPWSAPDSGPPAHPSDRFSVASGANGGPCPGSLATAPNGPGFQVGATRPVAGGHTPFVLRLSRDDGSQEISNLALRLPPGVLANLGGIPYCPETAIAAAAAKSGSEEQASPSCPDAAAVGGVEIGVGVGPAPYRASGRVYLAGPYKGAPLSLAVIVPALAGPYDLGTVVVRTALRIDPTTAAVTVETDPLPTILQGIPLDLRSLALRLDRPRFMVNPTNCKAMKVSGQMTSVHGAIAPLASRFRVAGCGRLGFKPQLSLKLLGPSHRGDHPRLRAVLRMPPHGAHVSRASVTLPPTEFLDNEHLLGICTREQFDGDACPANSVYGHARAWSPLLDRPLQGPVYLRSSNHRFPDLVADLGGQIRFTLRGRIDSANGGIRVNLEGLPDAAVDKFVLTMLGGDRGLLLNSADVCEDRRRASVEFEAHSGTLVKRAPMLRAQCRKRSATARAVRRASKRKSTRKPPSFGWKPTK